MADTPTKQQVLDYLRGPLYQEILRRSADVETGGHVLRSARERAQLDDLARAEALVLAVGPEEGTDG